MRLCGLHRTPGIGSAQPLAGVGPGQDPLRSAWKRGLLTDTIYRSTEVVNFALDELFTFSGIGSFANDLIRENEAKPPAIFRQV